MDGRAFNLRAFDRFRLDPMYTSVVVQRGKDMVLRTIEGHAYDVSEAGARIELDEPLDIGERIAISLRLPAETDAIYASAEVVWINDEDEDPAARRLAVRFTRFLTGQDRARLIRHLGSGRSRRAA